MERMQKKNSVDLDQVLDQVGKMSEEGPTCWGRSLSVRKLGRSSYGATQECSSGEISALGNN